MNEPTDKVNKPQKKYITYCLGFLLGIILTVALIFHFKSTYESNFTTEKALPKLPEITLEPSKSISSLQELSPPSQLACNKDANFIVSDPTLLTRDLKLLVSDPKLHQERADLLSLQRLRGDQV